MRMRSHHNLLRSQMRPNQRPPTEPFSPFGLFLLSRGRLLFGAIAGGLPCLLCGGNCAPNSAVRSFIRLSPVVLGSEGSVGSVHESVKPVLCSELRTH